MATANMRIRRYSGLCLRAMLPCAILAAGWFGYSRLAIEVENRPTPAEKKRTLRTRIEELDVIDYPVVIETHGVVQAHNQVTLTAEIAGIITKVSPSFEAGAFFAAGEFLVEIDPRNYAAAVSMSESRLLAAKSALKLAKLNEERKLRLIESNAVSQAEVDGALATREQAEADVDLAASQLEQAQLELQRTKVFAPFDGRVQVKSIGLGQMAGPNTPLGEIFAIDFAEVRLPISGLLRNFVKLPEYSDDPPVEVELRDAINESSEVAWKAKIVRTEGVLDENSRDLFAIARVDNPFGKGYDLPPLRIGQPVVASIEGIVLHDVIALPRRAVRQMDKIILVDRQDQTLLPLNVEAIWSDADHVIVDGSAIPKDKWLATTPMTFTPAGAKVEILPDAYSTSALANSAAAKDSEPATAQ
jgi:RND family efflux transporter MFP subunit